jgi:hypothetical protein
MTSTLCDRPWASPRIGGAWNAIDADNVRIHFRDMGKLPLARKAAHASEEGRLACLAKWYGLDTPRSWSPRVGVFLYETIQDYQHSTGDPTDGSGIIIYRKPAEIHLFIHEKLLRCLGHEIVHATNFFQLGQRAPVWADEGMAVLAEGPECALYYRSLVAEAVAAGELIPMRTVLGLRQYFADSDRNLLYYGQALEAVQILAARGPDKFPLFMHSCLARGEELALNHYYGLTVDKLEDLCRKSCR